VRFDGAAGNGDLRVAVVDDSLTACCATSLPDGPEADPCAAGVSRKYAVPATTLAATAAAITTRVL